MRKVALCLAVLALLSIPLAAKPPQQADNDPLDLKSYHCAEHLELVDLEDGRSDIVTVWAHGYYNGMRGMDEKSDPDNWITVEDLSEQILKVCREDPAKLFIAAVREVAENKTGDSH